MSLDTLEIAKRLEAAGFAEAQAEELSRVLYEQRALDLSQLATKTDLSREITELRGEMRTAIADLKYDLTWRFFGMVLAIVGVLDGILFALLRGH